MLVFILGIKLIFYIMNSVILRELCNGCGVCAKTCSEVFMMDLQGKAIVKVTTVLQDVEKKCLEAANQCPTKAIEVYRKGKRI